MGNRRKRRAMVAKIPPHRGTVVLTPLAPSPSLLQLLETQHRIREKMHQAMCLPAALLGKPKATG
ncbi:hypothetical protein GCM10010837_24220 [Aminobacter niigataensis]